MAEWTAAYINDLPDSAFACIDAGGDKDDDGRTSPRSLRHYPHHGADGSVDLAHLRNALSRVAQDDTTTCGVAHLRDHADEEGIGKSMTPMEHKAVPYAEFKVDSSGEFSGYASIFGTVDRGKDIVVKGAYDKALPAFLKDGFISWSHDWGNPIAMPTEAYEDDKGLFLAGRFHSTPSAQEARTIASERAIAGKRTGLSIGYDVEDFSFDRKGNRLLKIINPLFEVGFVMAPMHREANLAAVKAADGDTSDPSLEAKDMDATVARILGDSASVVTEYRKRIDLRLKEGRFLSTANRQRLADIREALDKILAETDRIAADDSGKGGVPPPAVLAVLERARFLGIELN
jgi:Escherichia/Staphylococcus phage prohead protease